jgi:hypothetical protein
MTFPIRPFLCTKCSVHVSSCIEKFGVKGASRWALVASWPDFGKGFERLAPESQFKSFFAPKIIVYATLFLSNHRGCIYLWVGSKLGHWPFEMDQRVVC